MFKTDLPVMPPPVLLTQEQVLSKMKEPAVVLVNVLTGKEFEKLHIQGSENLTLGPNIRSFGIMARKKYTLQTQFVTYGLDGESSLGLNAAKILVGQGFKADNYPGGLKDWVKSGLPTAGTDGNAPSSR